MFKNHEVQRVHDSINGMVVRTPCVFSPHLSQITNAFVYLKLENFQKTGSFKERGALNFLLNHSERMPVVTASAGNHAQAVALHAGRLGMQATIFMPQGTSNTKIVETERLKAQVRLVGSNYDEAYNAARAYADELNARYVHAYNDPLIILGQATVALEIYADLPQVDAIFVPIGGGGLMAGIGKYVQNLGASTQLFGVEAKDFDSMARALMKQSAPINEHAKTIAEGIAVKRVGELTQAICREINPELVSVSDQQIQKAIMILLERQKVVSEGAGASVVAALLSETFRHRFARKTVVLVVSGGNIDISLLARLTAQEMVKSNRLCRLSLVIKDTPGSLSRLLQTVTKESGNIVAIRHERWFANIAWNEVLVDVTIETKDEVHETALIAALNRDGYEITSREGEIGCVE